MAHQRPSSADIELPVRSRSGVADTGGRAGVGTLGDTSPAAMHVSLDTLVRLIERVAPGMRGSVLLLDDDGVTLRHAAAPSLPDEYCRLIDGEQIGPAAGSCGTAAYRHERVIVRDIATDPLWANYRQAAEPFGLVACWSTPIFGPDGHVLGTFAMYYGEPREPTPADIALTETAALLAANIVEGSRATGALRTRTEAAERLAAALGESETRYRLLAEWLPDQVWTATPDGRLDYVNSRVLAYFKRSFAQIVSDGWQGVVHADDLPRVLERWKHALATGEDYQVEFRLRRADGQYRCHIGRAVPERDEHGRVVRWFGTNSDIEDQRRTEQALRVREEQLQASQEQLRMALEASTTSTWRWDMQTNAVQCDEGLFRLFGVEPGSASGSFELFVSRIHADDRQRVIDAALRCAAEGVDLDEEFRIVRPDGSLRWAVDKGKTVLGGDGKPRYLIGACVDVTERRVRETQFRALAESLPQLAWIADHAGRRHWYNQRWLDYTGATADEMKDWGWKAVHHPDRVEGMVRRMQESLDTDEPWEDTVLLRGKDGLYRWFLGRAVPIRDADGTVVQWFGTNTDINSLREAELARDRALAEAKAERERLYEVFMQAPAAIAVLEGPQHTFAVANPLYRELVGGRDVIGKTVREALPELTGQSYYALLDAAYSSAQTYSAREQVVRMDRDGDGLPEEFYVDFVYQPLTNAQGHTFGIMVHAVETTDQVRARQEIAAARSAAEEANRAKSEFLAAMSHDLRTPLNAIGGYADLVKDGLYGPVTEAQKLAMTRVRRAQTHLLALINDILSFARVEAGRVELEIAAVPVREIVAAVNSLIEIQTEKKGLTYEPQRGADVHLWADRERTVQILVNLLTNAVKFTDAGSVSLDWQADDRMIHFRVRDTGRGIPANRLAAIFEPFVQAGRSTEEQQQGVGLGLAISRKLARAMGGDLSVESAVASGSTFTLTLPRMADDKGKAA